MRSFRVGRLHERGAFLWVFLALMAVPLLAHANDYGNYSEDTGQETAVPDGPQCKPDGTGCTCPPIADPISPFDGKWTYSQVDLVVPGVFPIRLVRRYDSRTNYQSPLGAGWAFTYDMRLFEQPDGSIVIRNACGLLHRYQYDVGAGSWEVDGVSRGWTRKLEAGLVAGEYVLSTLTGTRYSFDVNGLLKSIRDPQGNKLEFTYLPKMLVSGTSRYAIDPTVPMAIAEVSPLFEIKEVPKGEPASERKITFAYDAASGRLMTATTHDLRQVVYTPDPLNTGNLLNVTHTTGKIESFLYDTADRRRHAVVSWTDGQGRHPTINEYGPVATDSPPSAAEDEIERQVIKQTIDDEVWTITYAPTSTDFNAEEDYSLADGSFNCGQIRCTVADRVIVTPGLPDATAKTSYKFRPDGHVLEVIDALGHRTITEYPDATNPYPQKVTVERNTGTLAAPSRSTQKVTTFTYTADGQMETRTVIVDSDGVDEAIEENWEYDHGWVSQYQVTKDRLNDGTKEETFRTDYTFYREGANNEGIDPQAVTNIHQVNRLKAAGTPDEIETTEFSYNDHGRISEVTLHGGHKVQRLYYDDFVNRNGLVKQVAHLVDGSTDVDPHQKVVYDYDAQGLVDTITDSLSHTTRLAWDDGGRITQIENAASEITDFTYGGPTSTDPGDYLVQHEYGKKTGVAGRISQYLYDADGNLLTVHRQNGDDGTNPTFLQTATFIYDSDGNRVSQTDASSDAFTSTYDALGRTTSVADSLNPAVAFEYDATGNRTTVTDSRGNITDFNYDALDRLAEVVQKGVPSIPTTEFAYDAVGNVIGVDDPKDQLTQYVYDGLSRLVSVAQPLSTPVTYSYDAQGRLFRITNARGHVMEYDYASWSGLDAVDHFEDVAAADTIPQDPARTISYTYDDFGNLLSTRDSEQPTGILDHATSPDGSLYTYTYDNLNRVDLATAHFIVGGTDGQGRTLDATYNRFGERTDLNLAGNLAGNAEDLDHQWRFNDLGRLTGVVFPPDAPTDVDPSIAFDYYFNGDLNEITHANTLVSKHVYKTHGPLESIAVDTGLHKLVYSLDASWNITGITETLNATTATPDYDYPYDGINRLAGDVEYPTGLGLTDETLAYDDAGNQDDDAGETTPWDYDTNNRIITSPNPAGGADLAYAFDADGNLDTRTQGTTTDVYDFDTTNRLVAIHLNQETTPSITYAYDPFGRRIEKTVGTVTTKYLWDGDQLLAEYDSSGNRQVRYGYAGGFAPVQVAYGSPVETIYDVHTDHLDTPRMLTDANEVPVWRAAYQAYGTAHVSTDPDGDVGTPDPGIEFNVRFPGQYADAETGLHYNRFRYYDPGIGRYVSADPIGQQGGYNVYAYAGSNPPNFIDYLGLKVLLRARNLNMTGGGAGVHTFIEVQPEDGGPSTTFSGISGDDGELNVEVNYPPDRNPTEDNPLTETIEVPRPDGMSQRDWDTAVIVSGAKEVGKSGSRDYSIFGGDGGIESGNCNTTSSSILENAGGSVPGVSSFDPPGLQSGLRQ